MPRVLPEGVADGVAGPPDPDCLHHAGVSQLAAAKLSVEQLKMPVSEEIQGVSLIFSHLVFGVFNPLKCIPERK